MKRKNQKAEIHNFEQSLEQLKNVVNQLETGKLTLSESLQRYEEGIKHLKACHAALDSAQMKIEQLVKIDENGNIQTQPFDDRATFDSSAASPTATKRTMTSANRCPDAGGSVPYSGKRFRSDSDDSSGSGELESDWDADDGSHGLPDFEDEEE